MQKLLSGLVLGIGAAIWVYVYDWADCRYCQSLMIFMSIVSAARVASMERAKEVWR
jgi:hypothetical protein